MNRIYYNGYWFYDDQITYGSIHISNAMVCETLEADTLTVEVKNEAYEGEQLVTSLSKDFVESESKNVHVIAPVTVNLDDYQYGAELRYYRDDALIGIFYVESIQKVTVGSSTKYKMSCVSLVGLLINRQHMGGVYNGVEARDIILKLAPEAYWSTEVGDTKVYGYLPIASCRDNLQQLLFALGASILKYNGIPYICFNQPDEAKTIPSERIYQGGDASYDTQVTKIVVTEHSYYENPDAVEKTLYDNHGQTPVENLLIKFENPSYNFTCRIYSDEEDFRIVESGANYAIVKGSGELIGCEYVHEEREVSYDTGVKAAVEKEVTVTDATLVNEANSGNVAKRLGNYYSQACEISCGIVLKDEKTGDFIEYEDPFKNETTGYIKEMDITMSGSLKANTTIIANWKPKYVGNEYTHYYIITASEITDGKWTVPTYMRGKKALAVIFGGASGGAGGCDGEAGGVSQYLKDEKVYTESILTSYKYDYWYPDIWSQAPGGWGGDGGAGGKPGKMLKADITSLADEYTVSLGAGGAGGDVGGYEGELGEHTVFGTYDTDNGTDFIGSYVNLVSGDVYAKVGKDGWNGGNGGLAGTPMVKSTEDYAWHAENLRDVDHRDWKGEDGDDGESVSNYDGYIGGKGAGEAFGQTDWESTTGVWTYIERTMQGSGGGGAAYGASGMDATTPTVSVSERGVARGDWSIPGNGADALPPAEAGLGCGGNGGNGGGGGGSAGSTYWYKQKDDTITKEDTETNPNRSTGGKGTAGTKGSDGFVLIYYGDE